METELFVHFAEIAGVFIGFGALMSVRSARPSDPHDVLYVQAVLALGVWVVLAALLPIAVSRYGVGGPGLWRPCALAALVIWAVLLAALGRTSASRAINTAPERIDRLFPLVGLPLHVAIDGSLLLVLGGPWQGRGEALYLTALSAGVTFAGYTLLMSGLSQTHPSPTGGDDRP